ncbi:type VII secretion protein EssB/YukC [Oceanobacillus bengalensis]|nr:tetratricopeptide repeat protein [Oceanobacillus bengalensis]
MKKKYVVILLTCIALIAVVGIFATQIVQSNPLSYELELAKSAFEKEEYEDAIKHYEKVLKEDALHTEARVGLANAYIELSQYEDAIDTLNEGIDLKADEPQFYYFLSTAYSSLNDLHHLITTLQDGIAATDNTALKELLEELASSIEIKVDRHYVQKDYNSELSLIWEKNNGAVIPVTADWTAANESAGEFSNVDEKLVTFTGGKIGDVMITATIGSIKKEVELTVEEQVIEEITVLPEELEPLAIGEEVTLSVTGVDAGGEVMDFSPEWSLADDAIIELGETEGQDVPLTAINEGVTTIKVNYQGLEDEIRVVVSGENIEIIESDVDDEENISTWTDQPSSQTGNDVHWNSSDANDGASNNAGSVGEETWNEEGKDDPERDKEEQVEPDDKGKKPTSDPEKDNEEQPKPKPEEDNETVENPKPDVDEETDENPQPDEGEEPKEETNPTPDTDKDPEPNPEPDKEE